MCWKYLIGFCGFGSRTSGSFDQMIRFVTAALSAAFARLWHESTAKTAAATHLAAIEFPCSFACLIVILILSSY
jgi:hypothetical protein